jgi:hypothetical protein
MRVPRSFCGIQRIQWIQSSHNSSGIPRLQLAHKECGFPQRTLSPCNDGDFLDRRLDTILNGHPVPLPRCPWAGRLLPAVHPASRVEKNGAIHGMKTKTDLQSTNYPEHSVGGGGATSGQSKKADSQMGAGERANEKQMEIADQPNLPVVPGQGGATTATLADVVEQLMLIRAELLSWRTGRSGQCTEAPTGAKEIQPPSRRGQPEMERLVDARGLLETLWPPECRPSLAWVRYQCQHRLIPTVRSGNRTWFCPREVREALSRRQQLRGRPRTAQTGMRGGTNLA